MMEPWLNLKFFTIFLLLGCSLAAEIDTTVSNTNISISTASQFPGDDKNYLYNYDRLRLKTEYTKDDYFTTLITDGVHYFGKEFIHSNAFEFIKNMTTDTRFETQSSFSSYDNGVSYAKLYRFYTGYEDAEDKIIFGLQKISMGVGRLWTPSNLFNPRRSFSLEPDEIFGVLALNYSRHLSDTSIVTLVASQKKDKQFKYAAQYKNVFDFAEVGLNLISSDKTAMIGYELEANFFDTGIEVRSEGLYIETELFNDLAVLEKHYFTQALIGADYGFKNGISLTLETYYSSDDFNRSIIQTNITEDIVSNLLFSKFYMGSSISYNFNLVVNVSLTYIESFNDENSRFISPVLQYTFNDFNSFTLGALIGEGDEGSEYASVSNSYYLKYGLSF